MGTPLLNTIMAMTPDQARDLFHYLPIPARQLTVVVGEDAGSKLDMAKELRVAFWDETRLLALLGSDDR